MAWPIKVEVKVHSEHDEDQQTHDFYTINVAGCYFTLNGSEMRTLAREAIAALHKNGDGITTCADLHETLKDGLDGAAYLCTTLDEVAPIDQPSAHKASGARWAIRIILATLGLYDERFNEKV